MGLIYLDSCLLIYAVENDPLRGPLVLDALASIDPAAPAISPLVKMECLVKPMRSGDTAMQRRYEQAFGSLHQLSMPDAVFLLAAQLRAHHGLKAPDALHLACAQHHGCEALWTNDDRLQRASHDLARNVVV